MAIPVWRADVRDECAFPASRNASRAGRILLIAAAALGLAGSAMAEPYNPGRLPPAQAEAAGRICQSVMGLPENDAADAACTDSLMASAQDLDRGERLQAARAACLARGMTPGEPRFSECELDRADNAPRRPQAGDLPPEPRRITSYAYASQREMIRREQRSCAELGLDPMDAAFTSCVAGLRSAMFESEHPAQ